MLAVALLSAFSLTTLPATSTVAQELTIGSEAPALDIEHWVSSRDGEFSEVTEFESGKVYVVEFWATWCGPCISSMPHLVEIQNEYASKGVQIISVSREDLETVEKFLDRKVRKRGDSDPDAEPMTYAELTGQYCLTTDPDGSVNEDYMKAAGQTGIPCCFIVGKTGLIEWIGHPIRMDDALAGVVDDSWDREAFAAEFAAKAEAKAKFTALLKEASGLADDGEYVTAFDKIEAFAETLPADDRNRSRLNRFMNSIAIKAGGDLLTKTMNSVVDSKNPMQSLTFSTQILREVGPDEKLDKGLEAALLGATDKAIELSDEGRLRSMAIFTRARALLRLERFDESAETLKKAMEDGDNPPLMKLLKEVEKAKEEAMEGSDAKEEGAMEGSGAKEEESAADKEQE